MKVPQKIKIRTLGNSLAVQWLGLTAFSAVARVQSLVRELRSHKTRVRPKKKPQLYMIQQSHFWV